jgi:hypothetical protein
VVVVAEVPRSQYRATPTTATSDPSGGNGRGELSPQRSEFGIVAPLRGGQPTVAMASARCDYDGALTFSFLRHVDRSAAMGGGRPAATSRRDNLYHHRHV